MITANQLRAARALLNIDQRQTADLADLSVPTIQRMEASDGVIRANVDSLMKLVSALENAGIELINPGVPSSTGGRGVRLREHVANPKTRNARQPRQSSREPWSGLDKRRNTFQVVRRATVSTCSSSARRPCSMAVGVGGQPGMWRSTGITSETPPTTA